MNHKLRTIHWGLGVVGSEALRFVLEAPDFEAAAVIDSNPTKVGRDAGELLGLSRNAGVSVSYDAEATFRQSPADVVLYATDSGLATAYPHIVQAIKAGTHVISNCADLAFPWVHHPDLSKRLDELSREAGVGILGTGVVPGFVTDTFPLFLTTVCQQVKAVRVTRVVDAATRPLDYRHKFGFGLSPAGFKKSAADGAIGQLGLRESLFMIGDTLGWRLEEIVETIEPVTAKGRVRTAFFSLGKHEVLGLRQKAEGFVGGRSVICLDLEVSLGARNPRDEIAIDASPPISVTIPGGIEEGAATAAVMVNCLSTIAHGNGVGLLSMRDMPIAPHRNPQRRLSEDQPQELVTEPPTPFTERSPRRRTG